MSKERLSNKDYRKGDELRIVVQIIRIQLNVT